VCDVECGLAQPQKPMEERAVEEEEDKDKDTPASVTGRNCFFLGEEKKRKQERSRRKQKPKYQRDTEWTGESGGILNSSVQNTKLK